MAKLNLEFVDLPPLVEWCDCEDGKVFVEDEAGHLVASPVACPKCVEGERPTEFGEAVLELVRRFGGRVKT